MRFVDISQALLFERAIKPLFLLILIVGIKWK